MKDPGPGPTILAVDDEPDSMRTEHSRLASGTRRVVRSATRAMLISLTWRRSISCSLTFG